MSRVVVIDALNMFIRNYIVNPMISTNGNPIGGTVGFLNSVKKLMREARPDQVIICWDGSGGSMGGWDGLSSKTSTTPQRNAIFPLIC